MEIDENVSPLDGLNSQPPEYDPKVVKLVNEIIALRHETME